MEKRSCLPDPDRCPWAGREKPSARVPCEERPLTIPPMSHLSSASRFGLPPQAPSADAPKPLSRFPSRCPGAPSPPRGLGAWPIASIRPLACSADSALRRILPALGRAGLGPGRRHGGRRGRGGRLTLPGLGWDNFWSLGGKRLPGRMRLWRRRAGADSGARCAPPGSWRGLGAPVAHPSGAAGPEGASRPGLAGRRGGALSLLRGRETDGKKVAAFT